MVGAERVTIGSTVVDSEIEEGLLLMAGVAARMVVGVGVEVEVGVVIAGRVGGVSYGLTL